MTMTADELGELETTTHGLKVQTLLAAGPLLIAAFGWWRARKELKAARHELALVELEAIADRVFPAEEEVERADAPRGHAEGG